MVTYLPWTEMKGTFHTVSAGKVMAEQFMKPV